MLSMVSIYIPLPNSQKKNGMKNGMKNGIKNGMKNGEDSHINQNK